MRVTVSDGDNGLDLFCGGSVIKGGFGIIYGGRNVFDTSDCVWISKSGSC